MYTNENTKINKLKIEKSSQARKIQTLSSFFNLKTCYTRSAGVNRIYVSSVQVSTCVYCGLTRQTWVHSVFQEFLWAHYAIYGYTRHYYSFPRHSCGDRQENKAQPYWVDNSLVGLITALLG